MKKLLSVAEGEWEGLILGGLYTGQRLGDLASLAVFKQQIEKANYNFAPTN